MTKNQKSNTILTVVSVVAVICAGLAMWAVVASNPAQSTVKTVPIPQVSAQQYIQINTANDGVVDHYCVKGKTGWDGFSFGSDTGDFSVTVDDPLCR